MSVRAQRGSSRGTYLPEVLAALAGLAAAVASLTGFVPGLYRDRTVVIAQTHGYDVGNLIVVAVLGFGLAWSLGGSVRGRLVVIGALGCLAYGYVTYAFMIVLNPVTVLYIAVIGLAGWSAVTGLLQFDGEEVEGVERSQLLRRATGVFMLLLVVLFAFNWLHQIAAAVISGHLPADLAAAGWPMNPVWVLDLGFVLPLVGLGGVRILRRRSYGVLITIAALVFMASLSVTVLALSVAMSVSGQALDLTLIAIFGTMLVLCTVLATAWLGRPQHADRSRAVRRPGTPVT
jgi:hypothetical protein